MKVTFLKDLATQLNKDVLYNPICFMFLSENTFYNIHTVAACVILRFFCLFSKKWRMLCNKSFATCIKTSMQICKIKQKLFCFLPVSAGHRDCGDYRYLFHNWCTDCLAEVPRCCHFCSVQTVSLIPLTYGGKHCFDL